MSDVLYKGEQKGKLEIILTGIQNDVPFETLSLLTGYSIDEIKKIKQKNE